MTDFARPVLAGCVAHALVDSDLQRRIGERAAAADRGDADLSADVEDLRRAGLLCAPLPRAYGGAALGLSPEGVAAALEVLRALGRANLSLARLYEGHVNTVKLIDLYADRPVAAGVFERVRGGALLGVWGADDLTPVTLTPSESGCYALTGAKRFASGLGLVTEAAVTAQTEAGPQLLLVPVGETGRADPSAWQMSGMRATHSGTYDFDDVTVGASSLLGRPGDYLREPHFEGGVWRYCAAHLGGAEALYDLMLEQLDRRGRAAEPHQGARIAGAAIACETARLWIERAAHRVESGTGDGEAATAYALLARDVTENACLAVIDLVERALGMAAHAAPNPVERIRRDLSLFVRQAAPDDKRTRAARALASRRARAEFL